MVLMFYIDRYGDMKPHYEFVRICNGDFHKSYLQQFLNIPGNFIDFVSCFKYEDYENDLQNTSIIVYDKGEMYYF